MAELTLFLRQLRYTPVQVIWDNLTDAQKIQLLALLNNEDVLGVNKAFLKLDTD